MRIGKYDIDETKIPKVKHFRSLIKEYITEDVFIELMKITQLYQLNNNEKSYEITRILSKASIEFNKCGTGTNRMAIMINGFCIKIAMDEAGMMDNKREFKYAPELYPYSVMAYECMPNGLIGVFEYVRVFEERDLFDPSTQTKIRNILSELAADYFIGDIGLTGTNYTNWGYRPSTGEPVMLDFAYIYKTTYKLFICNNRDCPGQTLLQYDNKYDKLVCPKCGSQYTFAYIRKRISNKQQEIEVGDLRKQGYVLTSKEEDKPIIYNPDIDPDVRDAVEKAEKAKREESDFYKAQELYKEYNRKMKGEK